MLVVVEHGDFAALAQFFLDIETLRRFDVFQIDAAEGGFERCDNIDQFVGVGFVHFNVKHIDIGEFFEQYAFAFHHRFAGFRANIAQPQHRCAVGHHGNQVAACGVFIGFHRVGMDFHTRCGNARRIRQCQIVLRGQRFGWGNLNFARHGEFVEIQGGFFDMLIHNSIFLSLRFGK